MAIWHFTYSLVPRAGIMRMHNGIPVDLESFKPIDPEHPEALGEIQIPNYWYDAPPRRNSNAIGLASSLLPSLQSWSPEALMFGFENSHQIQLWEDDLTIRIDMRQFDAVLLRTTVEFAQERPCLVVLAENGHVLEPDIPDVLSALRNSRACHFVQDPEGTLKSMRSENNTTGSSPDLPS